MFFFSISERTDTTASTNQWRRFFPPRFTRQNRRSCQSRTRCSDSIKKTEIVRSGRFRSSSSNVSGRSGLRPLLVPVVGAGRSQARAGRSGPDASGSSCCLAGPFGASCQGKNCHSVYLSVLLCLSVSVSLSLCFSVSLFLFLCVSLFLCLFV